MSADNILGWEIVLKISHLPSKLRFSAKCSFFGQSLSRGHYQPTYQPPEGVYLLNNLVLSTALIMWIGHRKEIRKLTFRALALRRSESRNCGLCVVYIKHLMTGPEGNSSSRDTLVVYHLPRNSGNFGWDVNGKTVLVCPNGNFPK